MNIPGTFLDHMVGQPVAQGLVLQPAHAPRKNIFVNVSLKYEHTQKW
jgi:hypothetical protein